MKAVILLGLFFASASTFASAPHITFEGTAEGTVVENSDPKALSNAVDAADEKDLQSAIENQADQLDAISDELKARGVENNAHEAAQAMRAEARKPGLKKRLAGFFKKLGHDVKKIGITILKVGGYAGNAAADILLFPYDFAKSATNSAITGQDDDSSTPASGWVGVGVGAGVEVPVILSVASVATAGALAAPLAIRIATAALCSSPSLNQEPTQPGEARSDMNDYCHDVQAIDDAIEDPAVAGGQKVGAWIGEEARKVGQDIKSFFSKLFHKKPKAQSSEPAAPQTPEPPKADPSLP